MPKLLAEFLQEQQEPFSLDVYLLERGYCRGNGVRVDRAQFLKGSSICSLRRRQCAATNCSEFIKATFGKIVLHRDGGKGDKRLSSTKVFNSCSESDEEDARCPEAGHSPENGSVSAEEEADLARISKERATECSDCKQQLSPVSVLEETKSNDGSPLRGMLNFKATQCESSTSQTKSKQLQECVNVNSQYSINKRLLQQRKQLLIDCVCEVMENHRRRNGGTEQIKQILGAEELWKCVCENVRLWSKHTTNMAHLLHCDYMNSIEEWNADYEQKEEGIAVEMRDDILESIINEIVVG